MTEGPDVVGIPPGPLVAVDGSRPQWVLASRSPRRAEVLRMLGLEFESHPAAIEERALSEEEPERYVERLAREKAAAVAERFQGSWVLGGDTVVVLGGSVLEKPDAPSEAVDMLQSLAGRRHRVLTGMALVEPGGRVHSTLTSAWVTFRDLSLQEIKLYVSTYEPMDKAGAYGIQGFGAALVSSIEGDYYAVVGFSVQGLIDLFGRAGMRYEYGNVQPGQG